MGYYIQTGTSHDKAKLIAERHNGTRILHAPKRYEDIPEGKALIVVVDNGPFEAAAFAFNESEFECFTDPTDPRPVQYVLIPLETARELTGCRE
jgi:hypothetical protein